MRENDYIKRSYMDIKELLEENLVIVVVKNEE